MRVLIVRLSSLGDIVHGIPAVAGLAAARPEAEIAWAVQDTWVPLLERLPGVARVIPFRRRGGLPQFLDTSRTLRAWAPDVALDLQGNWKSGLVAVASGASARFGPARRREPGSSMLLVRPAHAAGAVHATDRALEVVRMVAPHASRQQVTLAATEAECARERDALRAAGVDPTRPFLVLLVARPEDPRSWPLALQRELARRAQMPAVFLFGPREADLPAEPDAPNLRHGQGELLRLLALGAIAHAAGGVVVGGDGGALHVLALTGVRLLALFGAQDPGKTGPVRGEILVSAGPPPCMPCRQRRCHHPRGPVCMSELSTDGVLARLGPLLGNAGM